MDDADRARRYEEAEREQSIADHRARDARRFTPYMIEGVPHCPECVTALPAHRIEAGICVPCLSSIEQQERRGG